MLKTFPKKYELLEHGAFIFINLERTMLYYKTEPGFTDLQFHIQELIINILIFQFITKSIFSLLGKPLLGLYEHQNKRISEIRPTHFKHSVDLKTEP